MSVRRASRTDNRSPTLASATEPSAARRTWTLPFFAVTTAAAPSAVPVDAAATAGREPSCLQPGTARIRARIAAARSTRRLYEAAPSLCKFHEVSGCARDLQQWELPRAPRPPERIHLQIALKTLVHAQALDRRIEEGARGFRVSPFAAPAHAPARVVGLASARVANPVEHAVRAQRQRFPQALLENLLHRSRQAEEDEARPPRSGRVRRLEDAGDVRVGQSGDHRRDVDAHIEPRRRQALDGLHPALRRGDVRFDGVRMASVPDGDADADGNARVLLQLLKDVQVALDQRRLRDDPGWIPVLGADLEASAGEPVARLERLVAVGDAGEDDQLAFPGWALERLPQQLRRLRLDRDLALEVRPGAEPEVFVSRPGIAVVTDDAVRDEVAGAGGDVVHRHLDSKRFYARDAELRSTLHCVSLDLACALQWLEIDEFADTGQRVPDGQIRTPIRSRHLSAHIFPAAFAQESMVTASDEGGAIIKCDLGCSFRRVPMRENRSAHGPPVSAMRSESVSRR